MAPPPTVILTLQEAVKVADALLIDALTSDNPSVQRYLCSYISETLSTIDEDTMDALRLSTSVEDRALLERMNKIHAQRDELLERLNALDLSGGGTDGRTTASNKSRAAIDSALLKLRDQCLEEQEMGLYVPLMAKANLQTRDDALFPLIDKSREFLNGDGQVMLLLGDSGAGKTTFNRQLELELWRNYTSEDPIPLYINLPTIDDPEHDMIAKQLHRHNFSADQIQELKDNYQFILICDGYDECHQLPNLYQLNRLNQLDEWRAKMHISCRSEYVGPDYKGRFQPPLSGQQKSTAMLFQEAVVAPFSTDQVELYIDQYIASSNTQWTTQDYVDKLNGIPGLMGLVQNPFLLTLALEALPKVLGEYQHAGRDQISRVTLYDIFIEQWLEIGKQRLQGCSLSPKERTLYNHLLDDGLFAKKSIQFLKDLSATMFVKQEGHLIVQYSEYVDDHPWKAVFFSPEAGVKIYRQSGPLTRSGDCYRFIHISWLEYFYSRVIYDPDDVLGDATLGDPSDPAEVSMPVVDHPLSQRSIVSEPSILSFLAERVQMNPCFKNPLFALIEESKTDDQTARAAANAITILVKAGVYFNQADLQGIRIPGADLSSGQFDSTQLQGADLQGVNLIRSWIRQTDLSGAQMEDVQFGELPYLEEDNEVNCCVYSPDGHALAVGLRDGNINIYDTTIWTMIRTLQGHQDAVSSFTFSPSGHHLVSGSWDHTVRLWNYKTGSTDFILEGHTDYVSAVAISPCGKQIASISYDKSLRLWNAQTGAIVSVLIDQSGAIESVSYSPSGEQVATGSYNGTIRIFDTTTQLSGLVIRSKPENLCCIAYSPDGLWIVSGHVDGNLQLWESATGKQGPIWTGHPHMITSVAFSPDARLIASSGRDNVVRLWNAQARILVSAFTGHYRLVEGVAFSPDGSQLASCSEDKTVRLWEVNSAESSLDSHDLSLSVSSVVYSPNGRSLVSGSEDGTIRQHNANTGELGLIFSSDTLQPTCISYSPDGLHIVMTQNSVEIRTWNAKTGKVDFTFRGHTHNVYALAFSPCGDWIATGSDDNTVRLWGAHSGTPGQVFTGHTDLVISVAFSPSSLQIISGSHDGSIRVWEMDSSGSRELVRDESRRMNTVLYSPAGQQIASSFWEANDLQLWDRTTGELCHTLEHGQVVRCFAFSSCGQWIVSDYGNSVWLWKFTSSDTQPEWRRVMVIQDFFGDVKSIAWKPQALEFVAGCGDGSVRVWKLQGEKNEKDGEDGEDGLSVRLVWSSGYNVFTASDTVISNTIGLSTINRILLMQRGAIDGSSSSDLNQHAE